MLQGFYSAASGVLMQQRHLNIISNNLANMQAAGFKAKRLLSQTFEEQLMARLERGNTGYIGTVESTRIVSEVANLWTAGGIAETQRPLDMAVTGYGFFSIQADDGETYYTRNGQFDMDDEGYLILRDAGYVLGTNGAPIQVAISDITLAEDGTLTRNDTGAVVGVLDIREPAENAVIEQARNTMYTFDATVPAADPMMIQGGYERSNVNLTDELSAMIMAQRNFSSASQALQWIDQTYAKAVNIAEL